MKTKKIHKKIYINILCMLFAVFTAILSAFCFTAKAFTVSESLKLDNSDVLADLQSDSTFNINDYPYNEEGELKLISFNEYCYSFYNNLQANYGLYVYIYNPQALRIISNSIYNKIELAVKHDSEGEPTEFEKFTLKCCSISQGDASKYYRLFYKFKVENAEKLLTTVNSNERRYDISGIELYYEGQTNAVEKNISKTYFFSGYCAGYGPEKSAESSLSCRTDTLESVELNVHHTYWRSLTSAKGVGYQNQVDSVYFSVPERFFEDYGKLQRIKAEWYEYLTKDIVVTSNKDFYNKAKNFIGVPTGELSDDRWGITYNEDIGISLAENPADFDGYYVASWGWNLGRGYDQIEVCQTLYYLFHTKNWCDIKNYDPYSSVEKIGGVTGNDLYDYILSYAKSYETGTVKDGMISADLFEDDISESRKIDSQYGKVQKGYSYYDFDADVDLFDLLAYKPGENDFFSNARMYGFWNALWGNYGEVEDSFLGQTPILILDKDSYFEGDNSDVADRLFVNANDVDQLRTFYNKAKSENERVVLFRFAVSDYYSADINIVKLGGFLGLADSHTMGQAYRAKESVFLDFDIIQLTFKKQNTYTVIPVISSPIDIVDDVTPSYTPNTGGLAWWWYVIFAFIGVFVIILFIKFFPYILKGLWYAIKYLFIGLYYVLASPFYLIRWISRKKTE